MQMNRYCRTATPFTPWRHTKRDIMRNIMPDWLHLFIVYRGANGGGSEKRAGYFPLRHIELKRARRSARPKLKQVPQKPPGTYRSPTCRFRVISPRKPKEK